MAQIETGEIDRLDGHRLRISQARNERELRICQRHDVEIDAGVEVRVAQKGVFVTVGSKSRDRACRNFRQGIDPRITGGRGDGFIS